MSGERFFRELLRIARPGPVREGDTPHLPGHKGGRVPPSLKKRRGGGWGVSPLPLLGSYQVSRTGTQVYVLLLDPGEEVREK